jgi:hypothetical protein
MDAETRNEFKKVKKGFVIVKSEFELVRKEMKQEFTNVRKEMKQEFTNVRKEMKQEFINVRSEMKNGFKEVKDELALHKVDIIDLKNEFRKLGIEFEDFRHKQDLILEKVVYMIQKDAIPPTKDDIKTKLEDYDRRIMFLESSTLK